MSLLILQCVVIFITAYISVNSLKKDLRSRTQKTKAEALNNKYAIIGITIVSITISIVTYNVSEKDKVKLNSDLKLLKDYEQEIRHQNVILSRKNDTLRDALNINSIVTSKLITSSQEKSAKQLIGAAKKLKSIITGSNVVPKFQLSNLSDSTVIATLDNLENTSIYNLSVSVINFENILKCDTTTLEKQKYFYLDFDCYYSNTIEFGLIHTIGAKSGLVIELPKYDIKKQSGKFLTSIVFNSKIYDEELVFKVKKGLIYQSLRIVEYVDKKINKIYNVPLKGRNPLYVNWNNEFPNKFVDAYLKKFRK